MPGRKLLLVINHAGFFLSHRLPIALAARERGYEVHIATPQSKHVPRIVDAGLPWHRIHLSRSSMNVFAELRTIADLVRVYRAVKPDIVHHVTTKPVLYGTIAARLTGVPAVVNALAGLGHVFYDHDSNRLVRRAVLAGYSLARRHRNVRFIFQNVEDRQVFLGRKWLRDAEALLIRGSGVDVERFVPAARGAETPVIMLASRLLYTKGVAELVAAAREIKRRGVRARFVVVGEPDPDNPGSVPLVQLQSWAEEGSIEYWGRQDDMPAVLAQADIFCMPTYYREGVPKSLIEAAACGIPIVTTDAPGCRDIARHGVNGLLVPARDVDRLVEALSALIEDSSLRKRMGEAGRRLAVDEFSLRTVIEATMNVYAEILP